MTIGISLVTFKTVSNVDSLSLSGKVKSSKIISNFLVLRRTILSESLGFASNSKLNSSEDFNNSLIRRTSALLSSIKIISSFCASIVVHQN